MSDAVSALGGAEFSGIVDVSDAGLSGMVTVRADLADSAIVDALKSAGLEIPSTRKILTVGETTVLWMSPDELLVVCAYEKAASLVASLTDALQSHHGLVVDVSDARAMIELAGDAGSVREVLAKLSPADLDASGLPVGEIRRSRLAQVPAAFWFEQDGKARVICFRSVADYVFGLLRQSAQPGSQVGYF